MLDYYLSELALDERPEFLDKYLNCSSLLRLKKIGYFCGMDYASSDIYDFSEVITRFDHSLTVALLTWKLTHDKEATLAGLFHDIATPCFSHVIDYMNKDYAYQESTEEYTEKILRSDKYLNELLKEDNIDIDNIIDFKKYSVVDNNRPKLCADRLDGIILTGIGWTKNISKSDIHNIINDIVLFDNEGLEIGFNSYPVAKKVLDVSESIDVICHSKEDNYMMELLAGITKLSIDKNYFTYEDLYKLNEVDIISKLRNSHDKEIEDLLNKFFTMRKENIIDIDIPDVKVRDLNPLVKNKRLK